MKNATKPSQGYCSELTQRRWRGQQGKALAERIEMLSGPGAEKRGQTHAGVTAFGTASATADFACNHQRTNTALSQVVVGRDPRHSHEDKQFREKSFHPF